MRLYLDTNILTYFLYNRDELSEDSNMMLFDYGNTLLVSSVCVHELIHLVQIGKVQEIENGRRKVITPGTVVGSIEEAGIEIASVGKQHLSLLAGLTLYDDHRDPNDRLIIAQAMADHIPLISSDRKFSRYERYGLKFIFNER